MWRGGFRAGGTSSAGKYVSGLANRVQGRLLHFRVSAERKLFEQSCKPSASIKRAAQQSTSRRLFTKTSVTEGPATSSSSTSTSQTMSNTNTSNSAGGAGGSTSSASYGQKFWEWTTKPEVDRKRWSAEWWADAVLKCTVFAITGTSSVTLVRPALAKVGIVGSLKDGPWSYRFLSLILVSPIYTLILLTVGTLAGRHTFFAKVAQRMWRRFLPAKWVEKLLCSPGVASALKKGSTK